MKKYKCSYCGRLLPTGNEEVFCSKECSDGYSRDTRADDKKIKYFGAGFVLGGAVSLGGILLGSDIVLGIGILLLSAVVVVFPFTTPDTVKIFGYKRAKLIGRALGALLAITGVWAGWL